jgi:zinc protease
MLFIEAERMRSCLYDPADCESERTVIISELQGGENDPEQLLDQELTATAFRAHSYRHPTIGWLSDLQTMTRDDLYGHYRRFYAPNNATLVIVGDVNRADAMREVVKHFASLETSDVGRRSSTVEPEQLGERRMTISKEGTTAYLKVAFHAPGVTHDDFFPLLVLDTILTGAKGLNLWASYRAQPTQRSSRLYQALVNTGLASAVNGALMPTAEPFIYTLSVTATDGVPLDRVEAATLAEVERARTAGITPQELQKAKNQLRARLVFENDSITNIAHQLGFFETVASWTLYPTLPQRIEAVTIEEVNRVAADRLKPASRTVGRFEPIQ